MSEFEEPLYFEVFGPYLRVTDGQMWSYAEGCDLSQLRCALAGTIERARAEGYKEGFDDGHESGLGYR